MLLTEEEAKTKRCQESFAAAQGLSQNGAAFTVASPAFGSSMPMHTAPTNCIGSACMAWRWGEPQNYEYGTDMAVGHNPADPGWEIYDTYNTADYGLVKYNKWRRALPGRKGFCGKTGRPQFNR